MNIGLSSGTTQTLKVGVHFTFGTVGLLLVTLVLTGTLTGTKTEFVLWFICTVLGWKGVIKHIGNVDRFYRMTIFMIRSMFVIINQLPAKERAKIEKNHAVFSKFLAKHYPGKEGDPDWIPEESWNEETDHLSI